MNVSFGSNRPLYTKNEVVNETKTAAKSALFSGALTLALNKGEPKLAGKVALIAAGASYTIGLVQHLIGRNKENQHIDKNI